MLNRTSATSKRNSNFELLRITSMLMIIASHFVVHGLMRYDCSHTTYLLSQIFYPLGKIGYVSFVALSMWFMVDLRFKSYKFFRLFFEVLFYSLIFGICAYFLTTQTFTIWTWISLFFPITGMSHNFIATYLVFYLITPFLKIIADKVNKKQLIVLLSVLFWIQIVSVVLFNLFNVLHPFSSEIILFSFFYFLMLFLKKYPIKLLDYKPLLLCILLTIWILIYCLNTNYIAVPDRPILKAFVNALHLDEGSIMNILAGLSLFFLFKSKKERHSKIINFVAAPTLGILLIHDNDLFKFYFWGDIIHAGNFSNSNALIILIILGMSLLIYAVAGTIDNIRKYGLENNIFKIKCVQNLCLKIDSLVNVNNL